MAGTKLLLPVGTNRTAFNLEVKKRAFRPWTN